MFVKLGFAPENVGSGLDVGEDYLVSDIKMFRLELVQTVCAADCH